MNIFVLDTDTEKASAYHCDRHCVKMPLETAQMLCTTHHLTGSDAPYKATHIKHPCNLWLMQSIDNYNWLCELGLSLCAEYTFRYERIHKCEAIIQWCKENKPNVPQLGITPFALAMPDECKIGDAVNSYRNYYLTHKRHLWNWKKRATPEWLTSFC